MMKISKFTALRLVSILMFPYSANAAAACLDHSDYTMLQVPNYTYEAVAYQAITDSYSVTNSRPDLVGDLHSAPFSI